MKPQNILVIYEFQIYRTGIFLLMFVLSCLTSTSIYAQPSSNISYDSKVENYRIGPGDVIDIVVSKNPTLSRTDVRVGNDGMIQIPMIDGDIIASCQTEKELAETVAQKYKKYLLNPNVIVTVKTFNSTPVTLIGSVINPTRFQLLRPLKLMDVLMLGNGPNKQAGPTVQIIRREGIQNCSMKVTASDSQEEKILTFSLKDTMDGVDQANPIIEAGDVIRVPEAEVVKIGQAYVIGNVVAAKTIDLKDPVTLTQAIAMAGGTVSGAQLEKVKISRQIVDSLDKKEIIVNLKEIKKLNKGDILLEANDIIEVPGPSGTRKFLGDLLKTAVPMITRGVGGIPVGVPIP